MANQANHKKSGSISGQEKVMDTEYKNWLVHLKTKIRSAQAKAAIAVNAALIEFYWELGKTIAEKENVWGSKLIEQVAKDLQAEFSEMKGLSSSNLKLVNRLLTKLGNSLLPSYNYL
jgi:hypothetical protein